MMSSLTLKRRRPPSLPLRRRAVRWTTTCRKLARRLLSLLRLAAWKIQMTSLLFKTHSLRSELVLLPPNLKLQQLPLIKCPATMTTRVTGKSRLRKHLTMPKLRRCSVSERKSNVRQSCKKLGESSRRRSTKRLAVMMISVRKTTNFPTLTMTLHSLKSKNHRRSQQMGRRNRVQLWITI